MLFKEKIKIAAVEPLRLTVEYGQRAKIIMRIRFPPPRLPVGNEGIDILVMIGACAAYAGLFVGSVIVRLLG